MPDSPHTPFSRTDGGLFRNANGKMQTWSAEENDLLRRLASEMTDNKGRPMWTTICQHLHDRTAQEVRVHTSIPEPRPHSDSELRALGSASGALSLGTDPSSGCSRCQGSEHLSPSPTQA